LICKNIILNGQPQRIIKLTLKRKEKIKAFFTFFVRNCIHSKMKIHFVLVEPKVAENIGASARAIKTMGFDSLVLVNPCNWREGKAKWIAHGSGKRPADKQSI
jgi:alkyl hydroperoxide reductase subunit AhpC